jgi:hypothetical protein
MEQTVGPVSTYRRELLQGFVAFSGVVRAPHH